MSLKKCAVCLVTLKSTASSSSSSPSTDAEVEAFYFVSKLCCLSNGTCERWLRLYGNPSEWFSFCGTCREKYLLEGKRLYDEIQKMKQTKCQGSSASRRVHKTLEQRYHDLKESLMLTLAVKPEEGWDPFWLGLGGHSPKAEEISDDDDEDDHALGLPIRKGIKLRLEKLIKIKSSTSSSSSTKDLEEEKEDQIDEDNDPWSAQKRRSFKVMAEILQSQEKPKVDVDDRKWFCSSCPLVFLTDMAYRTHVAKTGHIPKKSTHLSAPPPGHQHWRYVGKGTFLDGRSEEAIGKQCPYCVLYFETLPSLHRHIRTSHRTELKKWLIPILLKEEDSKTGGGGGTFGYKCSLCSESFSTIPYHNNHKMDSHLDLMGRVKQKSKIKKSPRRTWPCQSCGTITSSKYYLKKHMTVCKGYQKQGSSGEEEEEEVDTDVQNDSAQDDDDDEEEEEQKVDLSSLSGNVVVVVKEEEFEEATKVKVEVDYYQDDFNCM